MRRILLTCCGWAAFRRRGSPRPPGGGLGGRPGTRASRLGSAVQLWAWAGRPPRHRESDTKVTRGHITKQGSRLLRWALIEANQHAPADSLPGEVKQRIIARRGKQAKHIAKVAAARRLLTLVFYGMRDGQIRCLATP